MAQSPNPDTNPSMMKADFGTVCLITDPKSDVYLKKLSDKVNNPPENRLSRPCGGKGGFDDFVERWH